MGMSMAAATGDVAQQVTALEGRARCAAETRGAAHGDTIRAYVRLGELADEECLWNIAIAAWEFVVAADVPSDATADTLLNVSVALRGLAARRLAARRREEARELLARDLTIHEAVDANPRSLALSLENLAAVCERLGEREAALPLRERQLVLLETEYGLDNSLVRAVRSRVVALRRTDS